MADEKPVEQPKTKNKSGNDLVAIEFAKEPKPGVSKKPNNEQVSFSVAGKTCILKRGEKTGAVLRSQADQVVAKSSMWEHDALLRVVEAKF